MIIHPLKTNLVPVAVVDGQYAVRKPSGKVKRCSGVEWANWAERFGPQYVHLETRMLDGDSVLVVAAMFWGQSLFKSDHAFFWKVAASFDTGEPMEWYTSSETEAVQHCKRVAETGIEQQAALPLMSL